VDVTFHYTAHLKAAAGTASQTLHFEDGATLHDCFYALCKTVSPSLRACLINDQKHLRPAVLLCVNDQQMPLCDPTPLCDGSEITLLAAISGG
jgi:molybdopterin converting factor small subunit